MFNFRYIANKLNLAFMDRIIIAFSKKKKIIKLTFIIDFEQLHI